MAGKGGATVLDLQQAIREIRIAQAERDDVVVELRESERIRLELLAEALAGLRGELAEDGGDGADEFALAVLPGNPPRFWVDATSFVMMGRDKRHYRFLKDTRLGRTVLAEDSDVDVIADAVTRYIAERIVERERAREADWLVGHGAPGSAAGRRHGQRSQSARALIWALTGLGLGMICGAYLLLAYAWVSTAN
jgi:hypothetical protein